MTNVAAGLIPDYLAVEVAVGGGGMNSRWRTNDSCGSNTWLERELATMKRVVEREASLQQRLRAGLRGRRGVY